MPDASLKWGYRSPVTAKHTPGPLIAGDVDFEEHRKNLQFICSLVVRFAQKPRKACDIVIIVVKIANTADKMTESVTCGMPRATRARLHVSRRECNQYSYVPDSSARKTTARMRMHTVSAHRAVLEHANPHCCVLEEEVETDYRTAPETAHRTCHIRQEPRVVIIPDSVAHPRTVVIEAWDTFVDT